HFKPIPKPEKPEKMRKLSTGIEAEEAGLDLEVEAPPVDEDYRGPKFEANAKGLRDCDGCPTVIVMDRGKVYLGSPQTEAGRNVGESPQRNITIPYSIGFGKYEVLLGEFRKFVKETDYKSEAVCTNGRNDDVKRTWENPGFPQTHRHPVVCVSFNDALAYIDWLSKTTGRKFRLPSQAEWEFVARAGSLTPYATGRTITTEQANFNKVHEGTRPVGRYEPNEWKVYDTHGNAWEWVADCWTPDLSRLSETAEPMGLGGDCDRHIIKGGGWESDVLKVRSAQRTALPNNAATPSLGFRVVRDMSE
ncbi:MAG: SUMF1/EgtB/PvdO family nonheme iron enzyme, partial [Pseudomonadota bacterium]